MKGKKIDDIRRYNVDIFTVGSDWVGKFDYLNEFCEVKYLERTKGVSSSEIRAQKRALSMGIVGNSAKYLCKFQSEDIYVNGIDIIGICTNYIDEMSDNIKKLEVITDDYDELLNKVDSVYLYLNAKENFEYVKKALNKRKHVLCESPIAVTEKECNELFDLAKKNKCILVDAIRTAYSTAYSRLLLLLKSGKIGNILSIDVTCTSMKKTLEMKSMLSWGPNVLLPIFQILGTNYKSKRFIVKYDDEAKKNDSFTKMEILYNNAVATAKVAKGAKAEGDMIITGTKGYVYVPSPWWKTDYFEVRYEHSENNKRYFYQLDGEGIRYELVAFTRAIQDNKENTYVDRNVSLAISKLIEDFENKKDVIEII